MQKPDFALIETGINRGYAAGNNSGIRYALQSGQFDYFWILNNDTVIDCNALNALLSAAEDNPGISLFGSTIVDYYDKDKIQCAGGCRYWPLLTIFSNVLGNRSLASELRNTSTVRLDYVSGASMFMRMKLVEDIGLLDESYFLYYEELDYAKRMKDKGLSLGWCSASVVYHKGGISTGGMSNSSAAWTTNYHENLSTLKYTAKHYPELFLFACCFRLIMKLSTIILLGRYKVFSPLIHAYRDFFRDLSSKKAFSHGETPSMVVVHDGVMKSVLGETPG